VGGTSITPERSPGDLEESAMDGNFLERAARSVNGSADETTDSSQRVDMATFERWFRYRIETQPYTSTAIAFGLGWLLGRMHRPL
jgi:hypothetical protein